MIGKKTQYIIITLLLIMITSSPGCIFRDEESVCAVSNLLIDRSAFPIGDWKEIGSRDIDGAPSRIGVDRAGTSFSTKRQGVSVQHIYRFSTVDDANINYSELQRDWVYMIGDGNILSSPGELSEINLRADDYLLGCAQDKIETCLFVALYNKDVVEFKVDMPSMTYDDLVKILGEIDGLMQLCNEVK